MGYSTYFSGALAVTPPLNDEETSFLRDFADIRHTSTEHGPFDLSAGMHAGGNTPQWDKPAIWCDWAIDDDGNLVWDEAESTYEHERWLVWLIEHLLGPDAQTFVDTHATEDPRLRHFTCDHVIDGEMHAQGENSDDMWRIKVVANNVRVQHAVITYHD